MNSKNRHSFLALAFIIGAMSLTACGGSSSMRDELSTPPNQEQELEPNTTESTTLPNQ